MPGTGGELKERGTTIHARVSESEYSLLCDISQLGSNNPKPNISEGIRFCINFTAKVLALIPEAVMETVVEEYEGKIKKIKKEKRR